MAFWLRVLSKHLAGKKRVSLIIGGGSAEVWQEEKVKTSNPTKHCHQTTLYFSLYQHRSGIYFGPLTVPQKTTPFILPEANSQDNRFPGIFGQPRGIAFL